MTSKSVSITHHKGHKSYKTHIWFGAEEHRANDHLLSSDEHIKTEVVTKKHVGPGRRFRRFSKNGKAAISIVSQTVATRKKIIIASSQVTSLIEYCLS